MPTPEEQGTVESPISTQKIIGSVIRETGAIDCPIVDIGQSSGTGGSGGKGDPIEPFQDD